jgi:glycogen operon protein
MMPSDDRPAAPPADSVFAPEVFPLGAHLVDGGARFAVASTTAEAIEVCLLDQDTGGGPPAERRVELTERTFGVWHGTVPGIGAGQRYGFRVHGRYDPAEGIRSNPAKLLVDPYARQIVGTLSSLDAALGYVDDPMHGPPSTVDSAGSVPLSVLTGPQGEPGTAPPRVPWADTVIYELHVRGFTKNHPEVPAELRGSYLGLAHPAVVEHLRRLGVTAVELLPVHFFVDEPALVRRGAHNYWGYSTLGFLAPHAGYAATPGNELAEFAGMVDALHRAGIEVILDVVYNHTCEGDLGGPTLSFRGLDAPAYYAHGRGGAQIDITGCGNTVEPASPTVARLVCDSLRFWARLGVDGFRFDLASVLGRPHASGFDPHAGLLTMITSDPLLASRKLIAEPWDATGEGYRVGGFGVQWAEWNGQYRDAVRDFWRGGTNLSAMARRLSGSEELYAPSGRRPWASVNFVTAHDGFTLRDLVSYQHKHNTENGERNRDGTDDNRSQNFGVEGETRQVEVRSARLGTARALLATLLLSAGTPMLTAGDERWRTQRGNNNAYCQDNDLSWMDWASGTEPASLTEFTGRLLALRRNRLAPARDRFYHPEDVTWWRADGQPLTDADWHHSDASTLGMLAGERWMLVLHCGTDPIDFCLPPVPLAPVLDSSQPNGTPRDGALTAEGRLRLAARSVVVLLTEQAAPPG